MKQLFKIIVYSLIALLIVTGLLLFSFRNQILEYFHGQNGITESLATTTVTLSARETLDQDLLKAKRFTTLTNYAPNFDFDNICWRPDAVASSPLNPELVATGTELTATTTENTASLGCREGNDLPFTKTK